MKYILLIILLLFTFGCNTEKGTIISEDKLYFNNPEIECDGVVYVNTPKNMTACEYAKRFENITSNTTTTYGIVSETRNIETITKEITEFP